jgi:hypothetical protein
MGQSESSSGAFEIPELFYVHRKKSRILHINNGKVSKLNFSKKVRIREDSAIGFLSRNKIFICGGSDSAGCLSNSCFLVDGLKLTSKILPSLPCPCAGGFLFEFSRWVYFVGAVTEGNIDSDEDEAEVPAPLMRYNLREHFWEAFYEKNKEGRGNHEENLKPNEIWIQDLRSPQVFLFMGKLYFYGGYIKGKKGKERFNSRVYGLDLSEERTKIKPEKVKIPKILEKPAFVNRGSDVLIVGGTCDGQANYETWSLTFINKKPEITQEANFISNKIDNHPSVYTGEISVLFGFPEINFLKNKGKNWEKITIIQKTGKKPTPELNKTLAVEKLKISEKSKSVEKLKNKKKIIDSESEEEKINPIPTSSSINKKKKPFNYDSDE